MVIPSQTIIYFSGETAFVPGKQGDEILLATLAASLVSGTDFRASWDADKHLFSLKKIDGAQDVPLDPDIYFGQTMRTENGVTCAVAKFRLHVKGLAELTDDEKEFNVLREFIQSGQILDQEYTLDGVGLKSADTSRVYARYDTLQWRINWGGVFMRGTRVS